MSLISVFRYDHIQAALERLAHQFKESPNIKKYIETLLLESTYLDINIRRTVRTRSVINSEDHTLDMVGNLVGLKRPDVDGSLADDNLYRKLIKSRIISNTSLGTVDDIIRELSAIVDSEFIFYDEGYDPGPHYIITIGKELSSEELYLLKESGLVSNIIGVKRILYSHFNINDSFAFDGDGVGKGFGSIADPSSGGEFAKRI